MEKEGSISQGITGRRINAPYARFHRLSWSMMDKWLRCRRMFYYRYVGGIDTKPTLPLISGTLFHSLVEWQASYFQDVQEDDEKYEELVSLWKNDEESVIEQMHSTYSKIINDWVLEWSQVIPDKESWLDSQNVKFTQDDLEETAVLMSDMFKMWIRINGLNDLTRYRVFAVEPILYDIPMLAKSTDGKWENLDRWRIVGRVDLILIDLQTGNLIMREYKTTGASDARDIEKRVALDPQVRIYADALSRALFPDGSKKIRHIQYAVIRKKVPRTPSMIKCKNKKCKNGEVKYSDLDRHDHLSGEFSGNDLVPCGWCFGSGKMPSPNSKLDSTHYVTMPFLKQHNCDTNPNGIYGDLIRNLSPESRYVNLSTHYLEEDDILETREEVSTIAREIKAALQRHRRRGDYRTCFPRNTSQCSGPTGFCSYKSVCASRMKAEDVPIGDVFELKPDHPELED